MQATRYTDGALAWDRAAAKQNKKMVFVHVKQNKSVFTMPLGRNPHEGACSLADAQQIDRIWMKAGSRKLFTGEIERERFEKRALSTSGSISASCS